MRPKRSFYFLAVAILPLLFVLQNPTITRPLRDVSHSAIQPFHTFAFSVASFAESMKNTVVDFMQAFEDQGVYRHQIKSLQNQLISYEEIKKENKRLQKLLRLSEQTSNKSYGARVIGWDASPWRRTLIIDKGRNQGIHADMAVVVNEGLVGRVMEVYSDSARVVMLIDPDGRASSLTSESRAGGVVGGDGTSHLYMRYLELDSGVAVGETILTSGVGRIFPKGLPVGKITAIGRDPNGLHLKATVEPFVNFKKLEEVICIENKS